jgi:RND family efflux transporter MFP subunit
MPIKNSRVHQSHEPSSEISAMLTQTFVRKASSVVYATAAFVLSALFTLTLLLAVGCDHSREGARSPNTASGKSEQGATAGIKVIHAERRDMSSRVVQPGTIQAFEVTPVYSRISGYVQRYLYNIGDRVKKGDVLIEMWIPDYVEQHSEKSAEVKKADVMIRVAQSSLRAAEAKVRTEKARITSAQAGVRRAEASYTRWESEYKRLETLVTQRVLDVQVRDETYRQFQEAAAARDQAEAMVSETTSAHEQAIADRERAEVDVESARAQLQVTEAQERDARVLVEYGRIKAPYDGVITQRNVSPGDYLQPGAGSGGRPLFVLEQTDPVRVFVGVPELASYFIHVHDTATIRLQAISGALREGKVVRTAFSLDPSTRTLQTEIDVPNPDDHLRPGWYVTVGIAIERKQVWTLPSRAIGIEGQQHYFVFLEVDGKPVRTTVIIGPSDDTHTEVLKKFSSASSTNDWPEFDGTERVMMGNLEILAVQAKAAAGGAVDKSGRGETNQPK